ncbi:hypothetical protein EST38_g7288 [Candolleomyces aberdarensis]|uniref:Uncharacterized protein n=1 Tax=Candolleomyces aberdarensis TaxID=2316362 RepID=A0A4Q2DID5_9AGAR|nr:hypothetical protein EST38_g7288 [Candolleomyces aberdarensis]
MSTLPLLSLSLALYGFHAKYRGVIGVFLSASALDMYTYADLPDWSKAKFNERETPLTELAETFNGGTARFTLKQSSQQANVWSLWDNLHKSPAVATHAFIVRWTSPLDTGNYVPDKEKLPENLNEGSA